MIRKSATIGVAALALSLIVHFLGLELTFSNEPSQEPVDRIVGQVAVSDAFEDLAEAQVDPVEPEQAAVPEPPVETSPPPERAEAPTSEALVASSNPQPTPSPDRGTVQSAQSAPTGPVKPKTGNTPEPETDTPSGGTETAVSDARITPPVGSANESVAVGSPEGAIAASPPVSTSTVTAPAVAEPVPPVTDAPVPDVIASLPVETVPADDTLQSIETEQEASESDQNSGLVFSSLRPQIRPEVQSGVPRGALDGTNDQNGGLTRPTELIESPLTAYQREGTDLFAGQRGGRQSGGSGFGGALGPGNADVTNYAGEVLMHLNRVPPVAVSARGWARVVFRIEPNGSLGFVDIIDGSGSSDIYRAAKLHVSKGAPFPLPPNGRSRLLNFVYQIQ